MLNSEQYSTMLSFLCFNLREIRNYKNFPENTMLEHKNKSIVLHCSA